MVPSGDICESKNIVSFCGRRSYELYESVTASMAQLDMSIAGISAVFALHPLQPIEELIG